MSTIKKTLNSCRYPLQQFVNRINEYKQFASNNEKICTDEHILSGELEMTRIENKVVMTYKNVVFKSMFFSITQPNCFCLLDDGFLAQIVCIFKKDDRTIYIQYKQFSKLIPYFNTPCSSLEFSCGLISHLNAEINICTLDKICYKVMKLDNVFISLIHTD